MAAVEKWMGPGGTGVTPEWGVEADFEAELIEIRLVLSLRTSVLGVIPDDQSTRFWGEFWYGASPAHKKAFCDALTETLKAHLPEYEEDVWMERAEQLLAARFEACGGRALERPCVPESVVAV